MKTLILYAHPNEQSFNHEISNRITTGLREGEHTMPAILKGFIDRFFVSDFAYTYKGSLPKGLLKNKSKKGRTHLRFLPFSTHLFILLISIRSPSHSRKNQ